MKRLGGLWNKTSKKDGKKYLSGTLEYLPGMPVNIIVMKNDKKVIGSKQPDFILLLQDDKKSGVTDGSGRFQGKVGVFEEYLM